MCEHSHHHHHHSETENISKVFFLNLLFTLIEVFGGLYTNSVAILSDALHDLGDSISLGIAWYFQKVSKKSKDKAFSYGYSRFSLLGAIINSIILFSGSLAIIVMAIPRLLDPTNPDTQGMVFLAFLGVIFNGIGFIKLRKGKSINEKTISLHLLEDVLGWVAVLVGAAIMHFFHFPIIDPILSILIALYILYNVFRNLKKSITIILQGTPDKELIGIIRKEILQLQDVIDIHDCHLWTLDGEFHVFSAHLVVDESKTIKQLSILKSKAYQILQKHNIQHPTLEFEAPNEECLIRNC